jgi:hypothetical protein
MAAAQVPAERLLLPAPHENHSNCAHGFKTYFGEWPAYRLLFRLVYYERVNALPTMKHWLGGPYSGMPLQSEREPARDAE